MSCLKCGKSTEEKQAFCSECLTLMEKYPVKPGIAIHLPQRDTTHQEKKVVVRHRDPTAAEQAEHLQKMVRWLLGMIAVLSILLLLTAGMLLHVMNKESSSGIIGRNYTTTSSGIQP
ncbi:MAG: hypothetical protein IJX37_02075 [Oscillospiraceae bacterium]|nr:hypothetical protein [Oscillospiraceae bacterium]